MANSSPLRRDRLRTRAVYAGTALTALALAAGASAQTDAAHDPGLHGNGRSPLRPGSLVISGSEYPSIPAPLTIGQSLPGGGTAVADGTYPFVFNNDVPDASFGVTSKAYLYDVNQFGLPLSRIPVPVDGGLVTSFSSKSEMALNFSTTGQNLTFSGYAAQPNELDISNSNTPLVIDATNPVTGAVPNTYRVIADLGSDGRWHFTLDNAYSGNNERAVVLNNAANAFYVAGNAGNGGNPQPLGVVTGGGAQYVTPSNLPEALQTPGLPTPLGSFDISQLPSTNSDKIGKDDNFRGLTIHDNVVYFTKGSGSNGVDTVYFIDTTGKACPTGGVGVPQPGAKLPTAPLNTSGYTTDPPTAPLPSNMCILNGFPTTLAKKATSGFPFGLWFANQNTMYVADEGNGSATYDPNSNTYTDAAQQTTAGLQKWTFDGTKWNLAYTLQNGLNLGTPYTVPGYPRGNNATTGLPWAPATDGLRNITGKVNPDGSVTIYAVTSTVSGSGDQGADPNKVVAITDKLSATSPLDNERFWTVKSSRYGQVLRGVALVPEQYGRGFDDQFRGDRGSSDAVGHDERR